MMSCAALAAVLSAGVVPGQETTRYGNRGPEVQGPSERPVAPFDFAQGAGRPDPTQYDKMTSVHRSPDPWFGRDKAQHFVVSFLTTGAVSYSARRRWNCTRPQGVEWGLGLTLSLGVGKEIRDRFHPDSRASLRDLAADLLGAACGVLLVSWW
jgi:uncharacterized protein YfiM (DUF2279 family)